MTNILSQYSTTPFWLADNRINLEAFTTQVDEIPARCDVVIVGAGFTGLSAAITLARAGAGRKVVVLDAAPLGTGASCRNGGLLGPSFSKLGIDGISKQYGKEQAHAVIKESLAGFSWLVDFIQSEKIDCELTINGRFRGASHPKHYGQLLNQIEELTKVVDFPAIPVSREQQREEVGTDAYYGGVIYPTDGTLQPALLYQGLLDIATKAGVTVVDNTPVKTVTRNASGFEIKVKHLSIQADQVIIATNGYTGGEFGKFRRRVIPIRSAIIATEELPEELIRSVSPKLRCHGGTERIVSYYRPSPDGKRILFGGRSLGRGDQPARYSRFLHDFMVKTFPQLAQARIDHAWSGLVAYTFDHVPHIGVQDGMHYAMGYCGSGVCRANYFGRKIALKMLNDAEGNTSFDAFPFNTRPLYTGTPWFLPAVLHWHNFADRMGW